MASGGAVVTVAVEPETDGVKVLLKDGPTTVMDTVPGVDPVAPPSGVIVAVIW